ncbi:28343_t:CDS:2 [Gigaspora margarita]|uniref:28343_t:CDS:1 n=1 Tax=Gigaspora margarita TaxID=4874 RepID=A0ABN7W3I3_GIGMA|nr:28343_t:CDS:2 [Gigaspora margarita]
MVLNTRRQARRPRPQNTTNPPVGAFTAIQQYADLIEGSSPFTELQNAEISSQNTQYPTALFSGFSF